MEVIRPGLFAVTDLLIFRLVKEFEDPSLVPEYWVCSMNKVTTRHVIQGVHLDLLFLFVIVGFNFGYRIS